MKTHIYARIPIVVDTETGQSYFEIHHTTDPSLHPQPQKNIVVISDITINTQRHLGTNLTLFADQYPYDSTVGIYGGYKLFLHPDKKDALMTLVNQQ